MVMVHVIFLSSSSSCSSFSSSSPSSFSNTIFQQDRQVTSNSSPPTLRFSWPTKFGFRPLGRRGSEGTPRPPRSPHTDGDSHYILPGFYQ
ncbi:hypothetical protein E2C01_099135 [Portunus trituberculatus]|uniref:Secreted protein n=1 Tax=Portunus trituberculatus TaxID=210409 RepID=A0A5B7KG14_PORTR|nr:hypothetical protein [Portunus trituberculatus]